MTCSTIIHHAHQCTSTKSRIGLIQYFLWRQIGSSVQSTTDGPMG